MILDQEQIAVDYAKSYADKSRIYFIEKYLYTFNAQKGRKAPFLLFPRQKEFLKSLATNRATIAIKPRQCGITTVSSAFVASEFIFADSDSPKTVLCIGNKLDLANQLVTKIKDFINCVPRWFFGDEFYSPDPKSDKNKKDIYVKNSKSELELFNGCRVVARSSGENAARGISAAWCVIFDEAAFIENGPSVYASAIATQSSVPDAKTIVVSTPNGKDPLYYSIYKNAQEKKNNFNVVQFRWYQDPRYNKFLKWWRLDKNVGDKVWFEEPVIDNEGSVKYDEEHWEDMVAKGWKPWSPWYDMMCQQFNQDSIKIAQELDVSFVGSSDNVVDPEFIEYQATHNVKDPLEDFRDPMVPEFWAWARPIDGHRYILACIPRGEEVLTDSGPKLIENVTKKDLLYTVDGKTTKIKKRMVRFLNDDDKIVKIRMQGDCKYRSFTTNHPILSSLNPRLKRNDAKGRYWDFNFDFNNASNLKKKDWIKYPNIYAHKTLSDTEILEKFEKYVYHQKGNKLMDNPLLDEDFWWYCGMWLAEGFVWSDKKGHFSLNTSHHSNETEIHNKIIRIVRDKFNRKCIVMHDNNKQCTRIQFGSTTIAKFIQDNFGKYAGHKHIAEWIKFLPRNLKIKLFEGYFLGDGCFTPKNPKIECVSISYQLLSDFQDILYSCGYVSTISKMYDEHDAYLLGRNKISHLQTKYRLRLGAYDTKHFCDEIGYPCDIKLTNRRIISSTYISDDLKHIYARVGDVILSDCDTEVYNFEVEDETHTYCSKLITSHNCDPSRGSSEDNSAIEIIDIDARDENNMPTVEQVAECVFKRLGDDLAEIVYNYARLYNDAFVVVDCTNGLGDTTVLNMINRGYTNLYYDNKELNKYTVQSPDYKTADKSTNMPGLHMQGIRFQLLSYFANMIRNNAIKIRSQRVINELETWIFKGEAKRMDHMEGAHDDTICSLAMAVFVLEYSYNKLQASKSKDKAILSAYMTGGKIGVNNNHLKPSQTISSGTNLPYWGSSGGNSHMKQVGGSFMWLFRK